MSSLRVVSPCLVSESLLSISGVRPLSQGSGEKRNFKRGKRGEEKKGGEEGKKEGEREGREKGEKKREVSPNM